MADGEAVVEAAVEARTPEAVLSEEQWHALVRLLSPGRPGSHKATVGDVVRIVAPQIGEVFSKAVERGLRVVALEADLAAANTRANAAEELCSKQAAIIAKADEHNGVESLIVQVGHARRMLDRARRALEGAGFQDRGGEEWAPPLGKPPTVREQEAAAAGHRQGLEKGFYDGFRVGIVRMPWEGCYDWAAVCGQGYAKGAWNAEGATEVPEGPANAEWVRDCLEVAERDRDAFRQERDEARRICADVEAARKAAEASVASLSKELAEGRRDVAEALPLLRAHDATIASLTTANRELCRTLETERAGASTVLEANAQLNARVREVEDVAETRLQALLEARRERDLAIKGEQAADAEVERLRALADKRLGLISEAKPLVELAENVSPWALDVLAALAGQAQAIGPSELLATGAALFDLPPDVTVEEVRAVQALERLRAAADAEASDVVDWAAMWDAMTGCLSTISHQGFIPVDPALFGDICRDAQRAAIERRAAR